MLVLPVNTKTIKLKERFFNYLVVEYENQFYVHKRTGKDIWQNLYEFMLIETKKLLDERTLTVNKEIIKILNRAGFYRLNLSQQKKLKSLLTNLLQDSLSI